MADLKWDFSEEEAREFLGQITPRKEAMTKESRDDMIYRWSMTRDLQVFVRLGKELHPEIAEEVWMQAFKAPYKTGHPSKADKAGLKPKGISQEAINTLLDLSITTKEALDKSAEITITEAESQKEEEGKMRLKIMGVIPATDEERILLMQTLFQFTEEKAQETLAELKAIDEDAKQQTGRPTWDDFFAETDRQKQEAILQKMYGGCLTPEEVESFLEIE